MKKEKTKRSVFWWVQHLAAWAMLLVTILGAVVAAASAMGMFD